MVFEDCDLCLRLFLFQANSVQFVLHRLLRVIILLFSMLIFEVIIVYRFITIKNLSLLMRTETFRVPTNQTTENNIIDNLVTTNRTKIAGFCTTRAFCHW